MNQNLMHKTDDACVQSEGAVLIAAVLVARLIQVHVYHVQVPYFSLELPVILISVLLFYFNLLLITADYILFCSTLIYSTPHRH